MATSSETVSGSSFYKPPNCDEHKNKKLTHFCEDHQTLICDLCFKSSHRKCVKTTLREKSSDVNDGQLKKMLTRLSNTKINVEKLQPCRDKNVKKIIQQAKQCITDVKEFRRRIIETIDDLEKRACKVIEDAKKSREKHLQDLETTYVNILKQVNESMQNIGFCQSTRNKQIKFVGLKKASIISDNNEKIVSDLMSEDNSFHMAFQPRKEIEDLLHQVQELGHVSTTVQNADVSSEDHLLDVAVSDQKTVDIKSGQISGSTFLPNGDLVLCDRENFKLHLYSPSFTFKESLELPGQPWDICKVSDTEVVVTLTWEQRILFVVVQPRLKLGTSLKGDVLCFGIDCHDDMMYVTCHDNPGNGEVLVLARDGQLQRRFDVTPGEMPCFVRVSPNSGRIYISDLLTDTIACYTQQGDVVYMCMYKGLQNPTGIYVDKQDNILVCGQLTYNIHRVDKHGNHHSILVSKSDGIAWPYCISYRENDGALVVGMWYKPDCKVFWLKR